MIFRTTTALATAFLFSACLFDGGTGTSAGNTMVNNSTKGTGTGAGNTITARVLTLDGAPAAGAEVYLRPEGYIPDSVIVGADSLARKGVRVGIADAAGKISLPADTGVTYVLEATRGAGENRQITWRESVRLAPAESVLALGDLGMSQVATLTGSVRNAANTTLLAPGGIWVGCPGTAAFAKVNVDGYFKLTGLAPGQHELSVFRNIILNQWERIPVRGWRVFAGSQSRLDNLVLPAPRTGPGVETSEIRVSSNGISALACRDDATSLIREDYAGQTQGGEYRVLRTWYNAPQPLWVELNPCLGTWRKLGELPPDPSLGLGSFAVENFDFVTLVGSKKYHVLDSVGSDLGAVNMLPVREIEYFDGKLFTMTLGDTQVKIYRDAQAITDGKPIDSLDVKLPIASTWDIAIEDSILYYAEAISGQPNDYTLNRFDLRTRKLLPALPMTCPGGTVTGIVSAEGGGLWILDASNTLTLLRTPNAQSVTPIPEVLQRFKVEGAAGLSRLVRFRSFGNISKPALLSGFHIPVSPVDTVNPAPVDTTLSAALDSEGCLVTVAEMTQTQYLGASRSGRTKVLRSYLESTLNAWVELDPCHGTWRSIYGVPKEPGRAEGTYSSQNMDFLFALDRGSASRYDTQGVYRNTIPLPAKVSQAEYYNGYHYATFTNDNYLHGYADSASFWNGGQPAVTMVLAPAAAGADFAIVNGIVYWAILEPAKADGIPSDTVSIGRYSLVDLSTLPNIRLGGFKGGALGISSGYDGRLWLLGPGNRLYQFDMRGANPANPGGWKLERSIPIRLPGEPDNLYGLTRFHDAVEGPIPAGMPNYKPPTQ